MLVAERLASLGRLAAGVAHEMGAPLNVIKGRIEQLIESVAPSREKIERNLAIINEQADNIARTVRNLLNLGRQLNLRLRPVEISSLVKGVYELIDDAAAKSGIRLEFIGNEGARVIGDHELRGQDRVATIV